MCFFFYEAIAFLSLRNLASCHHRDAENEANMEESRGKIWKNQAPPPSYKVSRQALPNMANTWTSQLCGPSPPWFCLWQLYWDFFFLSLRPDWIFIPITVWCHVPRTIGGYVEDTDGRQATRVPLGKQDQHPQSKKLMTGTYIKWYTRGKALKVVILSIHES